MLFTQKKWAQSKGNVAYLVFIVYKRVLYLEQIRATRVERNFVGNLKHYTLCIISVTSQGVLIYSRNTGLLHCRTTIGDFTSFLGLEFWKVKFQDFHRAYERWTIGGNFNISVICDLMSKNYMTLFKCILFVIIWIDFNEYLIWLYWLIGLFSSTAVIWKHIKVVNNDTHRPYRFRLSI